MTIITKPVSEKKLDKLDEPLVKNEEKSCSLPKKDVEVELPTHMYQPLFAKARRVNNATTLCACLTAILVLTIGVIGGVYLYRQLSRAQMHQFNTWIDIPDNKDASRGAYQGKQSLYLDYPDSNEENILFREQIEIDLEYDYEKIVVPDFTGGRRGRFIHDFSANKTGIIDLDGRRCFVMTLNRSVVLPPHSLFDLILKMKAGYYEVDTESVRETTFIVYPPIIDFKSVGYYIARECASLNTYMLEKTPPANRRLFQKRSVDSVEEITFVEFAGKKIVHLNIIDPRGQYPDSKDQLPIFEEK